MKFLCLCGAYGSADKFAVQLAPLVRELSSDGTAELHFINGPVRAYPPEGFEEFFGVGEYYRFIESEKVENGGSDVLDRIRNFPKGLTPEDQMRELLMGGYSEEDVSDIDDYCSDGSGSVTSSEAGSIANQSAQRALDYLYRIMEKDGPFDGIIGYSEGATVAGTILLHEQMRAEIEDREPMFKLGVFFAGWPPMTPELDGIVLADQSDLTITIPTIHVIGSLDPYLAGSIALYNVCDMDTAYLFDHAKGHTLPRDKDTVKELGDIIRNVISTI